MIDGDVNEFVERIFYGDELWFIYSGKKYFLEGWPENGVLNLLLYEMEEDGVSYCWAGDEKHYPADDFLKAKIWDGKSFWEIEKDIQWVDC